MGVRTWVKSAELQVGSRMSSARPTLVAYGNCQAEAVAKILARYPDVNDRFRVVRIPAVHEMRPRDIPAVQRHVAQAGLIVTQPVSDGYRGLPLGTREMLDIAPSSARVVTFPSIQFSGLHPYLAAVHHGADRVAVPAPVVHYHDLRFVAAAARGLRGREAEQFVARFESDPDELRANAEASAERLAAQESEVDVQVASLLEPMTWDLMWTNNHPSNRLLMPVVDAVLLAAGIGPVPVPSIVEQLQFVVAPLRADVSAALGLPVVRTGWRVMGREIRDAELLAAHLDFYAAQPDLLAAAVREHGVKLERWGMVAA
ncbi:hypothetical protein AFL01nite_08120 [Aeromicrobium flavum]|uniref:Polysaccharide biosynthesis enzyme WcbI domain-containing protein n=1 Tax=Aeromicrobium flavum TaxID=416568 RepID=A0A512HSV9_9ACTN|nr:WcbI family polysaccharide biosynthesis putative acetyltransferase [Aeromicrobium flavum]GEO88485.1 hypothetical protein AFL01nite_08120 [Aeromicrobium flavum]